MNDLLDWLRAVCAGYRLDGVALFRDNDDRTWPLIANNSAELHRLLAEGGHFLALPKEPAALANILEVSIVDALLSRGADEEGLECNRGTERGYPDVEFGGPALNGEFYAVDIKVAKRANSRRQTQSRPTLYTGNTYFRYPQLLWPGTFRPFRDYAKHYTLLCLYDLTDAYSRVDNLELIVHETWRIASRQRSSTTREYIGAVQSIQALRDGTGEFASVEEFYAFWRKHNFKIGKVVQQQLDKLLAEQQ